MSFVGDKSLGVRLSDTSTTQEHELGHTVRTDDGKEFVYIQAAGAIAVADIVAFGASYDCAALAAAGVAFGVGVYAIADNSYGFIQTKGVCASAAVQTGPADGARLGHITGANGYLEDHASPAATDAVFAVQIGAQSSNLASVLLKG